jgi:uncharacterized protein (TIGR02271 family)
MAEHIVAVFRTNQGASAAAQDLKTAGIPASAIRQYASNGSGERPAQPEAYTSTSHSSGGFWSWLFGEDSESTRSTYATDVDAYDRTTAAGNVVLSVTVADDAKIHQAITALEAHHPIDIDERSDDAEGSELTSSTAAHSTVGREFSSGEVAQAGIVNTVPPVGPDGGRVGRMGTTEASRIADTSTTNAASGRAASSPEEVIPLAEEQLEVGKRVVDRGTTRIRRYVVEKPVEESVTLHGEKVTVERRQPIGTTAAPSTGAFEERVVEVRETAEEPVVSKSAHVAEEVVVGREAIERTETVRDTIRREEVEVSKGVSGKR